MLGITGGRFSARVETPARNQVASGSVHAAAASTTAAVTAAALETYEAPGFRFE